MKTETTETTALSKAQIISSLCAFVAQRGGLDPRDYGDWNAYRSESRRVTKDGKEARELLRAVELSSITAEQILAACKSAFSGRLEIVTKQQNGETWAAVQYCTGQYFPTEYRKAVCAVCASALWDYVRRECMPDPVTRPPVAGENGSVVYGVTEYRWQGGKLLSAGDWLRRHFRRTYGRAIASRWFD